MSAWKEWNKENLAHLDGEKILVRFESKYGETHIEDATVHFDSEGDPYYVLFDGESLTLDIKDWTHIPQ